jgi:hypothetical protein
VLGQDRELVPDETGLHVVGVEVGVVIFGELGMTRVVGILNGFQLIQVAGRSVFTRFRRISTNCCSLKRLRLIARLI